MSQCGSGLGRNGSEPGSENCAIDHRTIDRSANPRAIGVPRYYSGNDTFDLEQDTFEFSFAVTTVHSAYRDLDFFRRTRFATSTTP